MSVLPNASLSYKNAAGEIVDLGTVTRMDFTFEPPAYDGAVKRELLWAVHNLIAHPVSEIMHWLAVIPGLGFLRDLGLKFHDKTVPRHVPGTGRG